MKIKFAVLAALAAMSVGSASATVTTTAWGILNTDDASGSFFNSPSGVPYDHYFSFTLDDTYEFFTTAVANNNDVSIFSNNKVTLQQKTGPGVWSTLGQYMFTNTSSEHAFGIHDAGLYRVEVTADSTGSYTAYGTISTRIVAHEVPAVPEPETYALLLAGLGAMGFVMRRRNTA